MDVPETILGIQLAEACCTTEVIRNLTEGWGLLVLSNDGLIQVIRVEADMEGSIGLSRVGQGIYPLGFLGDWDNDTECDHVI